jgi:rSAM/selenodomain-associated transferase 1
VSVQLLLFAKAPQPGRVKTRLCPPATPEQAAAIAHAALADTIDVLSATPATRRTIVLSGQYPAPPGWHTVEQRGDGLAARLVHAYTDTTLTGTASLLVGMDTPQLTTALLATAARALDDGTDAVLGPTQDGGWWTLGLRDPTHAIALHGVPMSTVDTYPHTLAALHSRGLSVTALPRLRDIDTAEDAYAVAADQPLRRFAHAVRTCLPQPAIPPSPRPT